MIGATMRRLREERGLSQEELALRAHMSSGYLSKLERGLAQPSAAVLQKLAGCLQVPLADLYRAAGLARLLQTAPGTDPVLELYLHQIEGLPAADQAIISGVIQRILLEERAYAAEEPGLAPD
jgi:transcriptional regulator with XRE-family HTH domain